MDWSTLHRYGEEATLWSSLFINLWIFLTGAVVAFRWLFGQGQNWAQYGRDISIAWGALAIITVVYFGFAHLLIYVFHLY
jgi:hypothetical protein